MHRNIGTRRTLPAAAKGFTLVELLIVVLIIGVLLTIYIMSTSGSTGGARALALVKASDDMASSVSRLASTCGLSTTVAANPLPDTGKSLLDVVLVGESELAPTYKKCWKQASARALMDVAQKDGANYLVQGYQLTLAGGGTNPFQFTYANVPDEEVLLAAQRYSPSLTVLAASDAASPKIRYGTATGGRRDMTVVVQP